MNQYFIAEPGASPHGPYAEAMVKSAFEQRMYPPGTVVWWEGATQWEVIELVFGKETSPTVPPSLPPPSVVSLPAPPVHQTPRSAPVTKGSKKVALSIGKVIGYVLYILFVFLILEVAFHLIIEADNWLCDTIPFYKNLEDYVPSFGPKSRFGALSTLVFCGYMIIRGFKLLRDDW